jgi:hypothetical protein
MGQQFNYYIRKICLMLFIISNKSEKTVDVFIAYI